MFWTCWLNVKLMRKRAESSHRVKHPEDQRYVSFLIVYGVNQFPDPHLLGGNEGLFSISYSMYHGQLMYVSHDIGSSKDETF